ncbi:hypothetical protein [Stratiformator vulcanicus]|uniref:Uncharacterized protein n=1 Tax=Stratiformator vulcanicus TaxID=2527980 RepID=A0A517R6X4_9PLAN|nr:hypothetical protein [Stratiformator vulcanicus]QDT39638.1 hypothetical protein Pan189_40470 [Stratiformator vulcanicus]
MPLIANRVTERDLRDWLDASGYFGRSARVTELELAAISRPGWVQLFRFAVEAKHRETEQWQSIAGFLKDDERSRYEVRVLSDESDRDRLFAAMTDGMIAIGRREKSDIRSALVLFAVFAIAVAAIFAMLRLTI